MRFLFWNTYENTNINSVLCNIVVEQKINVITLEEYKSDLNDLIKRLWLNGVIVQQYITAGCERIIALGTEKSVAPNLQDKYYTIQQIGEEYLLCAAHLPSKCRKDDDTQELTISRFIRDIEQVEKECNIQKTIIVGDLNQNPYERGCLGASGFHGIPAMDDACKIERTISGAKYKMFYNPMWNFLGDFHTPPGTYYCNNGENVNPFWNLFDQVLIRPQLAGSFVSDSLKILTGTSNLSFLNGNNHPNTAISDHLPIVFEIREDL